LPTAPATAISAHKPGSGKTTTAHAIAQVCTGRQPPVLALSDDEAELRKTLLAILIAGDAVVLIDNVAQPVDSAALCALLTSTTYSDRMLGLNQRVAVPTASTWLITGNHLEFVGDLTSRVLLSVLDPEVEHPEARPFKRDLAAYITEHRGEFLAAALTIPLAYLAAGEPQVSAPRSRFAEWDRLVRRPLLWLGAADPLDTQALVRAALASHPPSPRPSPGIECPAVLVPLDISLGTAQLWMRFACKFTPTTRMEITDRRRIARQLHFACRLTGR
jgi:putative DNA primase/helicase